MKLFKWGDDVGLRLPPELIETTGLKRNDRISWKVRDDVAVMSKIDGEGTERKALAVRRVRR